MLILTTYAIANFAPGLEQTQIELWGPQGSPFIFLSPKPAGTLTSEAGGKADSAALGAHALGRRHE